MKDIVDRSELLKNNAELDIKRHPVPYFTCINFEPADYPRKIEGTRIKKKPVTSKKYAYKPGRNEIARQNLEEARASNNPSSTEGNVDGVFEEEDEMGEDDGQDPKRVRFE